MRNIIFGGLCLLTTLFAGWGNLFAADDSPAILPKLILDADTANEMDDMYAIVRLLNQDKFDMLGINSTQWLHRDSGPLSAEASHRINLDLVRLLEREDIPVHLGSNLPMGYPWGGDDPRDSAAVQFIINQVKKLPPDETLMVVCIGATTNLASAIKLAPEIVGRIRVYLMGFQLDPDTGIWNKSEFNVRRDLNAADYLLNTPGLELHVMSATVSRPYTFDRDDTDRRHESMGALGEYLSRQWKTRFDHEKEWVMWDLALIEAMLQPELATEKQVITPPENLQRKVWMYDSIDVQGMRDDYWQAVGQ